MTDRELKPCPFCGSEDVRFPESIGEPPYNACRLCGSMALIAKWNSRPIEDALRAEVLEKDACIVDLLDQRHDRDQDIANLRAEVAALRAECAEAWRVHSEVVAELKAELAKRDEPLRPALATFALAMELKLRENDHKGGWDGCSDHWLMGRLYDEASELVGAIKLGDPEEIASEAADVANFAMMIADIAAIRRVRRES